MSAAQPEPTVSEPESKEAGGNPFVALAPAFEHLGDSAVVFDVNGEIVLWNKGAEVLFGYTFEEARSRDISFLAPPEESSTLSLFSRALSGQSVAPRRVDRIRKNGERITISLRVTALENDAGDIFGVLFLGRDLFHEMEREARQTEIEMREREIAGLVPDALYVHRGGKIVWANEAAVEMFAARSMTDLLGRREFEFVADESRDRVEKAHDEIKLAERTGPISVQRKRLDGTEFPSEGRGARIVWEDQPATLVAVRDLSDFERTANALAESEARQRDFAEINPDAMIVHVDGRIVFANDAAVALFRADSSADLVGRPADDLVHPEGRAAIAENLERIRQGDTDRVIDVRRMRLDGTSFFGEGRKRLISWDGREAHLVVIRDASERVSAEHALRESEARHRSIIDVSPDGILVHQDGEIVFANTSAGQIFAAESADQLVGKQVTELVPEDLHEFAKARREEIHREGRTSLLEVRRRRLNGEEFIAEVAGAKYVWDGEPATLTVVRDLTDQFRTLSALRESQARLQEFADSSPDAIVVHLHGEIVFVNDACVRMYGAQDPSELLGRDAGDFIHPDDKPGLLANWEAARDGGGEPVVEARRLRLDGSVFVGDARYRPVKWDGRDGFVVVIRDVTERIAAETALRESEERHRKIVNVTPDAVIIHVADRIVFANQVAVEMFGGKEVGDLVGRAPLDLIPEDIHEVAEARLEQIRSDGSAALAEMRRKRLDGSEFFAEVAGSQYVWEGQPATLSFVRDISERVEAERAHAELAERTRKIVDLSPEAIFVHAGGIIRYVNPATLQMFGADEPEQMVGHQIMEFVHPDSHERIYGQRKVIMSGDALPMEEVQRLRVDGTEFTSLATGTLIDWEGEQGFLVLARDMTDQIAAQREIEESESRHRAITEASPDAIIVHADRKIQFANETAARMYGVDSPEDLLGRPPLDLIYEEDRDELLASHRVLEPGEVLEPITVRRQRDNGEVFPSETIRSGYIWNGQHAVMAVIRDISERYEAEQQILAHAEELERINEELERFAYVASHDLKEPLRMVSSFCGLLQERYSDKLDDQANEFIRFAVDGARRMQGLIEDLLKLSRTGTTDFAARPVPAMEVLETVKSNLTSQAADAGAEIRHGDLPVLIGDRTLLVQLFQNLISNAIKFRGELPPVVEIGCRKEDGRHVFSVSDNGIGLDPKHKERVFEVFKTLHARGKFEGNGIGLSICKKVVERHGGRIWVDSVPGEGTCFSFTLPVVENAVSKDFQNGENL